MLRFRASCKARVILSPYAQGIGAQNLGLSFYGAGGKVEGVTVFMEKNNCEIMSRGIEPKRPMYPNKRVFGRKCHNLNGC